MAEQNVTRKRDTPDVLLLFHFWKQSICASDLRDTL